MDSNQPKVRKHLAKFFKSISEIPRWWYIIKIDRNNQNSLSNLLGLSYREYITVFTVAGFIRTKGSHHEIFRSDQFQSFIHEFQLQLEIDVSNIFIDDQLIQRCYTVSVGKPRKHLDIPVARNQFKMVEARLRWKPRAIICHEQAVLRSHLDFTLNNDIGEPQQSTFLECSTAGIVIPDKTNSSVAIGQQEHEGSSETHEIQELLSEKAVEECPLQHRTTEQIKALLSRVIKAEVLESSSVFLSETFDPLTFADHVLETSKAILQLRNEHKASQRRSAGIAPIADLSSLLQPSEVAKKYPTLHHLNVDLSSVLQIHGLLRDILNLAKDIDDFSLLEFPYMNSKPCTVIAIPKCSQRDYFNATAKAWIFRLLDGLIDTRRQSRVKETEAIKDSERSRKDAVFWVLAFLGKAYPDEYLASMTDLGWVRSSGMLSPEELHQAMVDEGNISQRALRVIRKYLAGTSRNNQQSIFPSERKLRALGTKDPCLPTYAKTSAPDGKTIHYWYKPLDQLLKRYLVHTFQKEWRFLKFTLGADHGAGAEQVGVLVEAFTAENKLDYSEVFRIGEIECTKETTEILLQTLATHVNCGLTKMVQDGVLCEGPGPDGIMQFTDTGEASFVALHNDDHNHTIMASKNVHSVPFRVHMTRDMAWYAVALGKENSSTNWCWICKLAKSEWQYSSTLDHGPPHASLWSLKELKEALDLRRINEKSYLGVKRPPIIERLGPDRYEIPTLHLQLGITNNLIDCVLRYAQERNGLENVFGIPASSYKQTEIEEDLKQAWQEYQKHLAICIKKREDMALWDKEYGQLLLESRLAKKSLLEFYELENDNLLPSERRELQEDRMALNADIAKLNAERKALETMGKEAFNAFKESEMNLNRLRNQDDESNVIRTRIDEEAFIPFGADRPPEHGGQFHGGACRIIMGNACEIFAVIMDIFDDVGSSNGMTDQGKIDAKIFLEHVRDCLILFDGFFSCLYTPMNSMALEKDAEEMKSKAKGYLDAAINLWEALSLSITPKVHVAWMHAIERLPFSSEQWVEHMHQDRHKSLSRLRGFRNRQRRFTIQSQFAWRNKMANVSKIQETVQQKRALPKKTANLRRAKCHCNQSTITHSSTSVVHQQETFGGIDRTIVREETLEKWKGKIPEKLPTPSQLNTKESTLVER
jgi:hypothetical protein